METDATCIQEKRRFIEEELRRYPDLAERIVRTLLISLHSRGIVSIEEIHRRARESTTGEEWEPLDPQADNVQTTQRWDIEEKRRIHELALDHAARTLDR